MQSMILSASSGDVTDVMINGEFFLRQGQVMTYAEEDLKHEFRKITDSIMKKTGQQKEESEHSEVPEESRAKILPLTTVVDKPDVTVAKQGGPALDESVEEGFRIIKHDQMAPEEQPKSSVPPVLPGPPELPKDVKRIFGEDDV